MSKMIEIESTIRKWGNSFGIIVPKEVVDRTYKRKRKNKTHDFKKHKSVKRNFWNG